MCLIFKKLKDVNCIWCIHVKHRIIKLAQSPAQSRWMWIVSINIHTCIKPKIGAWFVFFSASSSSFILDSLHNSAANSQYISGSENCVRFGDRASFSYHSLWTVRTNNSINNRQIIGVEKYLCVAHTVTKYEMRNANMFVVIIIICVFNMRQLTSLLLLWVFHFVQCSLCIQVFFSSSFFLHLQSVWLSFFSSCVGMFFSSSSANFLCLLCAKTIFHDSFFLPFASSLMHNVILVLKLVHPDSNRIHVKWHVFVYTWKTKCERKKKMCIWKSELWMWDIFNKYLIQCICVCILGWSKFSAVIYLENGF